MDPEDRIKQLEEQVSGIENEISELKETIDANSDSETEESISETSETVRKPDQSQRENLSESPRAESSQSYIDSLEVNISKIFALLGGGMLVATSIFIVLLAISAGLIGPLGQLVLVMLSGSLVAISGWYTITNKSIHPWDRIVLGSGVTVAWIGAYALYGSSRYQEAIGTPYYISVILLTAIIVVPLYYSLSNTEYGLTAYIFGLYWLSPFILILAEKTIVLIILTSLVVLTVSIATVYTNWRLLLAISVLPSYSYFIWVFSKMNSSITTISAALISVFVVIQLTYVVSRTNRFDLDRFQPEPKHLTEVVPPLNALLVLIGSLVLILSSGSSVIFGMTTGILSIIVAGSYTYLNQLKLKEKLYVDPYIFYLFGAIGITYISTHTVRIIILLVIGVGVVFASNRFDIQTAESASHLVLSFIFIDLIQSVYFTDVFALFDIQVQTIQSGLLAFGAIIFYSVFIASEKHNIVLSFYSFNTITSRLFSMYAWAGTVLLTLCFEIAFSGWILSLSWAILGCILIGIGLYYKNPKLRFQAISVLLITTVKVLLIDTAQLEPLPRILSFFGVSVVLLSISYLYLDDRSIL